MTANMHTGPKVVIVGTKHRLQTGHVEYSTQQQAAFEAFLEQLIKKYSIEYVAEEMVSTILPAFGVTETLVRKVSVRCGKKYEYIDLSEDIRSALQIDRISVHQIAQSVGLNEAQFRAFEQLTGELREYLWLVQILSANTWPALFVCGANHAPRVHLLFNSVGILAVQEDHE